MSDEKTTAEAVQEAFHGVERARRLRTIWSPIFLTVAFGVGFIIGIMSMIQDATLEGAGYVVGHVAIIGMAWMLWDSEIRWKIAEQKFLVAAASADASCEHEESYEDTPEVEGDDRL